ncbi:MAG: branched-chain amino acid ABC transporter permease [Chloroflexota bacterium]
MSYYLVVGTTVAIYVVLSLSLNIVVGYAGQPNLGQGAFFGIGAYFEAVLTTTYGISFWIGLVAAALAAATCGAVLGVISLRLKADYLAISTIGINFVAVAVFQTVPFFGGSVGIYGIPLPSIGSYQFDNTAFFVMSVVLVLLVAGLSFYLERTWFGSALLAIKDDEHAAASIGIRVAVYKVAAFTISTALAGMIGGLYAAFLSVVTPTSFGFTESVVILSMLVFGGLGTIRGAIVGAAILGVLPEAFRFISDYRLLTFGAILLLTLRFQPQGLLGRHSLLAHSMGWLSGHLAHPRASGVNEPDATFRG